MNKDLVPELLEVIAEEFEQRIHQSITLKNAMEILENKRATYLDAHDFAIEAGEILSDILQTKITADVLPDGKMYYNIADRILNTMLVKNYELISNFVSDVQTELNQNAGLRLKGKKPELNQNRIDGFIERLADEENFEAIKWLLADPIVNFSQSIVDDGIKTNANFHEKAGLSPKIIRRVSGHACEWCETLAGTYSYSNAPEDVYRRHERCRCTVDYNPGDGRKQDVWSKSWRSYK